MYIAPPSPFLATLFINDTQETSPLNLSVYIAPPSSSAVLPSNIDELPFIVMSFAYTAPPLS